MKFKTIKVAYPDIDVFAACMASMCYMMNNDIDEVEAFEIIRERLLKGPVSFADSVELALMIKATKFDPDRNVWQ